jgi:Ca2+-binding EF-hand superfamily protein
MHPLLSRKKIKEDALRNIFNRYDNKKGYIDIHDFISLIISLGDNLNENEIRDYFINANLKRNGKIDFKEFLTIWENIN